MPTTSPEKTIVGEEKTARVNFYGGRGSRVIAFEPLCLVPFLFSFQNNNNNNNNSK